MNPAEAWLIAYLNIGPEWTPIHDGVSMDRVFLFSRHFPDLPASYVPSRPIKMILGECSLAELERIGKIEIIDISGAVIAARTI